jgi:hypothetical protein
VGSVSCTDKDEAPGALLVLLQRMWPLLRWRLPFDMDRHAQLRVNKVAYGAARCSMPAQRLFVTPESIVWIKNPKGDE